MVDNDNGDATTLRQFLQRTRHLVILVIGVAVVAPWRSHAGQSINNDQTGRRVFGQPLAVRGAPLDSAGPIAQRPTMEQTQAMVAKTLAWFGGEAAPPDNRRAAEGNAG